MIRKLSFKIDLSVAVGDSLRPWSQSQIAPRFGYKHATGMFA